MAAAPTAVVSAVKICRRLRPMVAPGELGIAEPSCFNAATAGCRRSVHHAATTQHTPPSEHTMVFPGENRKGSRKDLRGM